MYHQLDMDKSHKYPEVVPTADPKDWNNTLEMAEEYIKIFCGVDVKPPQLWIER